MSTLTQLITRVEERLSMAAGNAVQIYAEDRIGEMIQHKFDVLFDLRFWPQFSDWITVALDGTLGVSTTDLTSYIKRFEDIGVIYKENSDTHLNILSPLTSNPNNYSGVSSKMYGANSSAAKVFTVWPKTATGNLDIYYRNKPDPFVSTDEIDFDDQALILGAAWDYLEDDGTNPNASQKMQILFENRVKQLEGNLDKKPIALDPYTSGQAPITITTL